VRARRKDILQENPNPTALNDGTPIKEDDGDGIWIMKGYFVLN